MILLTTLAAGVIAIVSIVAVVTIILHFVSSSSSRFVSTPLQLDQTRCMKINLTESRNVKRLIYSIALDQLQSL